MATLLPLHTSWSSVCYLIQDEEDGKSETVYFQPRRRHFSHNGTEPAEYETPMRDRQERLARPNPGLAMWRHRYSPGAIYGFRYCLWFGSAAKVNLAFLPTLTLRLELPLKRALRPLTKDLPPQL